MSVVPLSSPHVVEVRRFNSADAAPTLAVFRDAVRRGTADHYTLAERAAWAPSIIDLRLWSIARAFNPTWVAEVRGVLVGFVDLKPDGEVDMLFVHPDHTRRGIGATLLDEVERVAREAGAPRLHARVSLTAQPLFRRQGFALVREQWVERRGERLVNAVMEKLLEPVA